jgi:hypothetical protein
VSDHFSALKVKFGYFKNLTGVLVEMGHDHYSLNARMLTFQKSFEYFSFLIFFFRYRMEID